MFTTSAPPDNQLGRAAHHQDAVFINPKAFVVDAFVEIFWSVKYNARPSKAFGSSALDR